MKYHLLAITSILLITGCNMETRKKGAHSALGELAEVMIFTDQTTLGECDGLIDSVWGKIMPTMSNEPYYKVRKSVVKDFDGYANRNYNLFILIHKGNWDKIKVKMKPGVIKAVEKAFIAGNESFRLKNVYAQPQIIYFLIAEDVEDLKRKMREGKDDLLYNAIDIERKTTIESLIQHKIQYDSFFHQLIKKEGYAFRRPEIFNQYIENVNFYGISHYVADKKAGVYTYSEPFTGLHQFNRDYILNLRDSMLKKYIKGPVRPDSIDTYMQTYRGKEVPIEVREVSLNGHYAVEIRGSWEMANEFMAGPFVSYTVHSKKLNRVITLEGNVFAPGRSKRKLLRECELIISTFTDEK